MNIYLVGGAVRDQLLGYPYHEKDWVVVGATAQQLLDLGYQAVGKDFPVFLHPKTKEEYALARTERKTAPGYKGFECFANPDVTLEEDLQRRDLTINAIAQDSQGNIIDPYNGQQDLINKTLRHTSQAFTEDPLRVLRIARFQARYAHLGFDIADDTKTLMQTMVKQGELTTLVAERVWKELERALNETTPSQFFISLDQCHALTQLIPEFLPIEENLSQTVYDTIDRAANIESTRNTKKDEKKGAHSKIRFSLLFINSSAESCSAICERIKAPNEFKELAQLVCQFAKKYFDFDEKNASTENLLQLLKDIDAFRRPQRFEDFLLCCQIIENNEQQNKTLLFKQALSACKKIKAEQFVEQGLKGKAIAQALQTEHIKAIKHLLQQQD